MMRHAITCTTPHAARASAHGAYRDLDVELELALRAAGASPEDVARCLSTGKMERMPPAGRATGHRKGCR